MAAATLLLALATALLGIGAQCAQTCAPVGRWVHAQGMELAISPMDAVRVTRIEREGIGVVSPAMPAMPIFLLRTALFLVLWVQTEPCALGEERAPKGAVLVVPQHRHSKRQPLFRYAVLHARKPMTTASHFRTIAPLGVGAPHVSPCVLAV